MRLLRRARNDGISRCNQTFPNTGTPCVAPGTDTLLRDAHDTFQGDDPGKDLLPYQHASFIPPPLSITRQ